MSLGAKDFRLFPKAFVVVAVMVNGNQIHRHYTTLNVCWILYFKKKENLYHIVLVELTYISSYISPSL